MSFVLNFLKRNFSSSSPERQMAARKIAEQFIADNPVAVFSKSYCPYCNSAKRVLKQVGANAQVIELDHRDDGGDIQAYLLNKTGQRTVPNIFIGGKHIGGSDDLNALNRRGGLTKALANL